MSGPKGYQLELARRARIARETDAARARCANLVERIQATRRSAAAIGRVLPQELPHAGRGDLEGYLAQEVELTQLLDASEAELTRARQGAATEHLQVLWAGQAPLSLTIPTGSRASSARPDAATGMRRADLAAQVTRCVDSLAELSDQLQQVFVARCQQLYGDLAIEALGVLDARLMTLKTDIENAREAGRAQTRLRRRVADLLGSLADIDPAEPELVEVREFAAGVGDAAQWHVLQDRARSLRARVESERDAAFVLDRTKAALMHLGYAVGPDLLVSASMPGHTVIATRPDLPEHGLRIQVLDNGKVLTRVVAFGETDPSRDREVEEVTCQDLGRVQESWAAADLTGTLFLHHPPGEREVLRVEAGPATATRPAARTMGN